MIERRAERKKRMRVKMQPLDTPLSSVYTMKHGLQEIHTHP